MVSSILDFLKCGRCFTKKRIHPKAANSSEVEVVGESKQDMNNMGAKKVEGWETPAYEDPRARIIEPYHSTEEHYQTMAHFQRMYDQLHMATTSYYDIQRRPLSARSSDSHLNWRLNG